MEKTTYAEKLKHPKWQKLRLEILKRDKFKCKLCNDEETTLQVHHKEYLSGCEPWEYDKSNFITLCEHCHIEVTKAQKKDDAIDYANLKVYKSNNWKGGSRIMFVCYSDNVAMTIYSDDGEWVCGYNLGYTEQYEIVKILKHGIRL